MRAARFAASAAVQPRAVGSVPAGFDDQAVFRAAGLGIERSRREDHKVYCIGYYRLPNEERRYRDWKKEGHGRVDLNDAIVQSCDVYFYDLAYRLGIDRMSAFMENSVSAENRGRQYRRA